MNNGRIGMDKKDWKRVVNPTPGQEIFYKFGRLYKYSSNFARCTFIEESEGEFKVYFKKDKTATMADSKRMFFIRSKKSVTNQTFCSVISCIN